MHQRKKDYGEGQKKDKLKNNKDEYLIYVICIIPVIWASLIVAPYIHENIFDMFEHITNNLKTPLKIKLVSDSLEVAIIFIFVYIVVFSFF